MNNDNEGSRKTWNDLGRHDMILLEDMKRNYKGNQVTRLAKVSRLNLSAARAMSKRIREWLGSRKLKDLYWPFIGV